MSRSCAVAFQSLNKSLVKETRANTLGLYRSLLRSSEKYQHAQDLKNMIREKFKQNKTITSRPRVLKLLNEADKTQQFLEKGNLDNQCIIRVNAHIEQQKKSMERIDISIPKKKKTGKKPVERKPYQVAITTQHSPGCEFRRVRGWRQPVRTAMMIKNRVKTNQKRLDKFYEYKSQLDMIRSERTFLENLGCLPGDRLMDYERNIKMAMDENSKYDVIRKSKDSIADE